MKHFLKQRKDWIAVLGGSVEYSREQACAAFEIGKAIAVKGKGLVTGATTGIPYAAAMGVKEAGGLVVGISPAATPEEHFKLYRKPLDYTDFIIYSGVGYDCRSSFIVRSAAALIFIGGEMGTLKEFASAWLTGNSIIAIMTGFGGITDRLEELAKSTRTDYNNRIVVESDPQIILNRITDELHMLNEVSDNLDFNFDKNSYDLKKIIHQKK